MFQKSSSRVSLLMLGLKENVTERSVSSPPRVPCLTPCVLSAARPLGMGSASPVLTPLFPPSFPENLGHHHSPSRQVGRKLTAAKLLGRSKDTKESFCWEKKASPPTLQWEIQSQVSRSMK